MIRQPKFLYTCLLCALCICISSCSKKKNTEPFDNDPIATRTLRYLTQKPWKETKLEYKDQSGIWIEKPLPSDVATLTNVFKTDGTYVIYNQDGTTSFSGIYDIIGDNTQLALNKSITYDFSILNDAAMQLTLPAQIPYTDPVSGNTTGYYGMRQTFSH